MLAKGVLLEGYRIDGLIGEGGMGVVYEATQLSLDRKVALKLLSSDLSIDEGFRQRFRVEARIQAALEHPNIVTVHEAGESEHGLFIAMELIRGATLKDLIMGRELEAGRTLRILSQVADALDTAHEAGLIHRDIKPHNILVRAQRRDTAYLADFGVTKVRGGANLTRTGQFVGTIDYMAPEQIRGEQATRATDIYAMGTVLYECLSGEVPFVKDSDVAVMYAHLSDPPPRLSDQRPDLPAALDTVIETAMAKNPVDRYETAEAMVAAFEQALGEEGKAVATPPPPIEIPEEMGLREPEQVTEAPAEPVTTPPASIETILGTIPAEQTKATPVVEEEAVPAGATVAAPVGAATSTATPPETPIVTTPPPAVVEEEGVAAPAERRPLPLVWIGAGVVVLALAAVGFLIGHSSKKTKTVVGPGFTHIKAAGADVTIPSTWRRAPGVTREPGVTSSRVFWAAASPPVGKGLLLASRDRRAWPTLLPPSLVANVQGGSSLPQHRQIVQLGQREGLRYGDLTLRNRAGTLTVFAVPQGSRVQTFACLAEPGAPSSFERDCEGAVASAKLPGTSTYTLVPPSSYATSLSNALSGLAAARATGVQSLRTAKTGKGQGTAAAAIANAYRAAAGKLASTAANPLFVPVDMRIRAALNATASAYERLGAAASAGSRSRYNAARQAVTSGDQALRSALEQLSLVGFRVE